MHAYISPHATNAALSYVLDDVDLRSVLGRLETNAAGNAAFDSFDNQHDMFCLPGTRVKLLREISEWALDPTVPPVFWLNGRAGTGKSTIARTMAKNLALEARLGASFFFKRGELDRANASKFFSTIALDLTRKLPAVAPHVKAAIESDPTLCARSLEEQFEKPIRSPMRVASQDIPLSPLVIIVDALDECEREQDILVMIHLFSRQEVGSTKLKFFVTSRPELPISSVFKAIEGTYEGLILHAIPESVVQSDIEIFLWHRLSRIRDEWNLGVPRDRQLLGDWPGQAKVLSLAHMATPLFIFAETVCRFVADRATGPPDEQLTEVLLEQTKSQESQLDATYLPVLNSQIKDKKGGHLRRILEQFQNIVGPIILLESPLTTTALGKILGFEKKVVDSRLDLLHSVLDVPPLPTSPVRLFHLSFRDFLLDPEKKGKMDFWIDKRLVHATMLNNCLRVMGYLHQDICRLRDPGIQRRDISSDRIDAFIPQELKYACLSWIYHLHGAGEQPGDSARVYAFLKSHLLHWVEVLSILGRNWEIWTLLRELEEHFQVRQMLPTYSFIY